MLKKLILPMFILILAMSLWGYIQLMGSPPQDGGEAISLEISPGDTTLLIAQKLKSLGAIRSEFFFRVLSRTSGLDGKIQIGEYLLEPGLTPEEILHRLTLGKVIYHPFTVREGLTVRQIGALIEEKGLGTQEDFLTIVKDQSLLPSFVDSSLSQAEYPLEGYLFPDTYYLPKDVSLREIVVMMVKRLEEVFSQEIIEKGEAMNLTPHQMATLASIVEKEAAVSEERDIIAAVYLNRLSISMKLDACPTVAYAVGKVQDPITFKDLEVESPYNTYRNPGLPPGPIANFGQASLLAVLNPASVDYLYFVSKNDGTHAFSRTLSEHNANIRRYQD